MLYRSCIFCQTEERKKKVLGMIVTVSSSEYEFILQKPGIQSSGLGFRLGYHDTLFNEFSGQAMAQTTTLGRKKSHLD